MPAPLIVRDMLLLFLQYDQQKRHQARWGSKGSVASAVFRLYAASTPAVFPYCHWLCCRRRPSAADRLKLSASEEEDLVLEAVAQRGYALKYASEELRESKAYPEIVRTAVSSSGHALRHASAQRSHLASDLDLSVIVEAAKSRPGAVEHADLSWLGSPASSGGGLVRQGGGGSVN